MQPRAVLAQPHSAPSRLVFEDPGHRRVGRCTGQRVSAGSRSTEGTAAGGMGTGHVGRLASACLRGQRLRSVFHAHAIMLIRFSPERARAICWRSRANRRSSATRSASRIRSCASTISNICLLQIVCPISGESCSRATVVVDPMVEISRSISCGPLSPTCRRPRAIVVVMPRSSADVPDPACAGSPHRGRRSRRPRHPKALGVPGRWPGTPPGRGNRHTVTSPFPDQPAGRRRTGQDLRHDKAGRCRIWDLRSLRSVRSFSTP